MRVLYVCHRVPFPPKRGGKIRPFHMIRHLTEQGHDVVVASLARNADELTEAEGLRGHCRELMVEIIGNAAAGVRMLARAPSLQPSSFGYFWSPALARRIRESAQAAPPDLIFVHCSSVAPYVAGLAATARIIDFGDMDSQKWREYSTQRRFPISLVYWLEAIKLERAERNLTGQFDLATCTTAAELGSLLSLGSKCEVDWFPNGVDAQFFAPVQDQYDRNTIVFLGRMDYFPNQQGVTWFVGNVWPLLRTQFPSLQFQVVGADPPPHIRDLARIDGVTVTGSVADVRPYVQNAALTVAPLAIARGTQNKILESLAAGTPVVCSPRAAGGVDVVAGEHLLVADSPQEWCTAIGSVLADSGKRTELAVAGRARVLSQHAWAASMKRLDGLIANLMQRKQRA